MEININCDLGEKSKHHSNKYDPDLLEIVNSANLACGYHAGDNQSMTEVVQISKRNGVSIGAHPSFNDPENFGRKRMDLSSNEIINLLYEGVRLFIPLIFFFLIVLKYFITSRLVDLFTSIPKSQYKAASPRFDIFLIMPCYTSTFRAMEININCDLGEKSKHHSNKYDPDLLEIVNSANVACGYHAGDNQSMTEVVQISKRNGVSIGAHPSFNDPENFGRKRMDLSSNEIKKLIFDQYEILQNIAQNYGETVTHIKPHGALNNMACEDINLATTLANAINEISKDLIYLVPTGSKMEQAAKKLNMKIACEIFADRNYEDDGNLVSRKKPHALITDPEQAKKHVLSMVKNQSLNCHSGKQIPCEIDSVCIHGDNMSSLATAKSIKNNLIDNGLNLKPLNKMKKFRND